MVDTTLDPDSRWNSKWIRDSASRCGTPTTTTTSRPTASPATSTLRCATGRSGLTPTPTDPNGAIGRRAPVHVPRRSVPDDDHQARIAARHAACAQLGRLHRVVGDGTDPARVPGPRRAPRADGPPGSRDDPALPDAGAVRRALHEGRHRAALRELPRLQPLARRGLGLRPRGAHPRRAAAVAARSRPTPSPSSSSCSSAVPERSSCAPVRRSAARPPTRTSTRSGPGSTRPAFPSASTSASRATTRCSPRTGASRRTRRRTDQSAFQWTNLYGDRPIMDTISALILHNLFGRFPNVQCVSVENGSLWVPYLLKAMNKMNGMGRNGPWLGGRITDRPSDIFRAHVSVSPYHEEDIAGVGRTHRRRPRPLRVRLPAPRRTRRAARLRRGARVARRRRDSPDHARQPPRPCSRPDRRRLSPAARVRGVAGRPPR